MNLDLHIYDYSIHPWMDGGIDVNRLKPEYFVENNLNEINKTKISVSQLS